MYSILIVEDEINISKLIKINLEKYYDIEVAYDGETAIEMVSERRPSLMILDIMLPKMNGYDVLRTIRNLNIDVPVIMLTAKSQDVDKILGLELGADDYITKPFNPRELTARVKALIRRIYEFNGNKSIQSNGILSYGDIKMDLDNNTVTINGKDINLTKREFELLKVLMLNKDRVVTREELIDSVWGDKYDGDTKTLDVHIKRLREKIEINTKSPNYVKTQWGIGYYIGGSRSEH
ncbi:response regulator transcription factor [Thermoanaerobacterium sp. RBIITD]|uniref:response regulator transcription factor n=1 Tax=Thermoanaerobacterium sp. RBIITD TaxID=1550240 RepID=UPI000BB99C27|nr:response regulator transcription factor [Thermoanaerobacterium sp. RBIITD]SNX54022.1 two-component system, OmpR family, response regulator VicR [Thermoanaerobacterium sp. RBIITD]